jgi:hypothetical protein
MSGFLGDLSEVQQKDYDSFHATELDAHVANLDRLAGLDRARIEKKEGRPATEQEIADLRAEREGQWPHELLRYLRAWKWDVEKARSHYREYLQWRVNEKIDSIMDRMPFNIDLINRCVGNNAAGEDKEGRPLYIEKSAGVNVDAFLSFFSDEDIMCSHLWQQENSVRRCVANSKKHGRHIENFAQIVDLTGCSVFHQRALKFTKMLFNVDATYYPERLGHLYAVNAPWAFPIIWAIVKSWIDPVTRSKINIHSDHKILLQKFDADQLPAEYGGTCDRCASSPDCCKEYPLSEALELLPFRKEDEKITEVVLKAGKSEVVKHQLKAGQAVEWFWELASKNDVDFSVSFQPTNPESKPTVPVSLCRIEGLNPVLPAQGTYGASEDGEVTITWDNSFSWLSSKTFCYWSRVAEERTEATPERAAERAAKEGRPVPLAYTEKLAWLAKQAQQAAAAGGAASAAVAAVDDKPKPAAAASD